MGQYKRRDSAGLPRGLRRDRDCLTCKERGVKCDLNRPGCGPCAAASIKCGGYPSRIIWKNPPQVRNVEFSFAQCDGHRIIVPMEKSSLAAKYSPSLHRPIMTDHQCLNESIYFTSYRLSSGSLPVVCIQVSNAAYKEHVRSCTRTTHRYARLKAGAGGVGQSDIDTVMTDAVTELNAVISYGEIHAIFGISTLAFLDVAAGNLTGDWSLHVQGAKAFLDVMLPNVETREFACRQIPGLRPVVSLLIWYDVLGTIIRDDAHTTFDDIELDSFDVSLLDTIQCPADCFKLLIGSCSRIRLDENIVWNDIRSQWRMVAENTHLDDEWTAIQNAWRCFTIMTLLARSNSTEQQNARAVFKMARAQLGHFTKQLCTEAERAAKHSFITTLATIYDENGHTRRSNTKPMEIGPASELFNITSTFCEPLGHSNVPAT